MNTYKSGWCPECHCVGGAHLNGCPEQPEEKPVYKCSVCGDGIYVDDKCKELGGGYFCYSCLQNLSPEEWLDLLDDPIETAQPTMEEVNA